MAQTTPILVCLTLGCLLQGGSSERPEEKKEIISVAAKHLQREADLDRDLDRVLGGATAEQKQTLYEYGQGHRYFQKASDLLTEHGKKLAEVQSADFAAKTEEDQFAALHQETAGLMTFMAGLKGLNSMKQTVEGQQQDALHVLQSLGLETVSAATRHASQGESTDVDEALKRATVEQKEKLMDYRHDHMRLQKFAHALSDHGEKLYQASEKNDFAAKSEDEKFEALEKETSNVMDFLEGLKMLKSQRNKVREQQKDAVKVLKDLGLKASP